MKVPRSTYCGFSSGGGPSLMTSGSSTSSSLLQAERKVMITKESNIHLKPFLDFQTMFEWTQIRSLSANNGYCRTNSSKRTFLIGSGSAHSGFEGNIWLMALISLCLNASRLSACLTSSTDKSCNSERTISLTSMILVVR